MKLKSETQPVARSIEAVQKLIRSGRFSYALEIIGAMRESDSGPDRDLLMLLRAEMLQRTGSAAEASAIVLSLLDCPTTQLAFQARCEAVLGSICRDRGELNEAIAHFQRATAMAEEVNDIEASCWSHLRLMLTIAELSGPDAAVALLANTRRMVAQVGDTQTTAALHLFLGEIETKRGLFDSVGNHLRIGKRLLQGNENAWLQGLGEIASLCLSYLKSDLGRAIVHARDALRFAHVSGHAVTRMAATSNLGHIFLALGDFDKAERWLDKALSQWSLGGGSEIAILDGLAQIGLARDDLALSERCLSRIDSVAASPVSSPSYYHLCTFQTRARLLIRKGLWDEARRFLTEALETSRKTSVPGITNLLRLLKAEALLMTGGEHEAAELIYEAASSGEGVSIEVLAEIARVTGKALARAGDMPAAISQFERSAGILASLGNLQARTEVLKAYREAVQLTNSHTPLSQTEAAQAAAQPAPPSGPGLRDVGVAFPVVPSSAPTAEAAIERAAALIDLAAYPEILGHEAFSLLRDTAVATEVVLTSTSSSGRHVIAHAGCDAARAKAFAASRRIPVRLKLGSWHDRPHELAVNPATAISSRMTVLAIEKLVRTAVQLEETRREQRERTALWPVERRDESAGGIFASRQMIEIVENARKVAPMNVTILLTGETGTGKEIVAQIIHRASKRAGNPFVPFNCTAVPKDMLDSQLFGYRRGAFTGAHADFPGVIRAATGGTLFLDEIGDIGLDVQPKLLRFLESGEILPLGESRPVTPNVRVIASTNAQLERLVAEGRFREDLFYRLNVIRFRLPPLRERREEVPPLVDHFLERYGEEFGHKNLRVAEDTMEYLLLYRWPGNVRELANEMRRLAALAESSAVLMPEHLKSDIVAARRTVPASERPLAPTEVVVRLDQPLSAASEHLDRAMIQHALRIASGNFDRAARALGLSRKGLYLKRQRLGIDDTIAT